jgi:hypothetical protein
VREELERPYEAEIQEVKNKSFSKLLELFSFILMDDVDGCICGTDTCQACHPTPSEHVPDPVAESWELDDEFGMDIDWRAADSMHGEKRKPLQAEGDGSLEIVHGVRTKRVCRAHEVLGKRKFDDEGDEESKQSKQSNPAVYEDERPIKRLKNSHQAVEDLPSSG